MFKNVFKRCWLAKEVIDYLMTLPLMFRIDYTVDVNGHEIRKPIRNEDGKIADSLDTHDVRITSILIQYQEDGFCESYHVNGALGTEHISYIKTKFDNFIKKYPITGSKVPANRLYDMQRTLRQEIEKVTGVIGAYDGKDIVYNLGALREDARSRVLDTVSRFGKDCVSTTLVITVSGSTDEEIGATLTELAMAEVASEDAVDSV